jgi:hypothetical protein
VAGGESETPHCCIEHAEQSRELAFDWDRTADRSGFVRSRCRSYHASIPGAVREAIWSARGCRVAWRPVTRENFNAESAVTFARRAVPSAWLRIGYAIRYMAPHMRPASGRASALLVRGQDPYGHFEPEPRPRHDFDEGALAAYGRAMQLRTSAVFQDAPIKR